MADKPNPTARLKAIQDRLKAAPKATTKAVSTARPAPNYNPKAGKSPGKLFGSRGPHVSADLLAGGDESVSVVKAAGYLHDFLPAERVKAQLDLSDRLKAVYGPYFPFANANKSMLVPTSAAYLPTEFNGQEIAGAKEIKKEVRERLKAGVAGFDPDEAADVVRKSGGMFNKALNTLTGTDGGSLVPPPALGDLIDLQTNLEVFSQAGASNVDLPPNGRVQYPKLTGGATAYWVGETQTITPGQPTTGVLNLEAKKLAVRVPLTNELMKFSSLAVEGIVRADMARQGALKADLAMLEGTGGTQIKGLTTYPTAAAWTQNTDKLLAHTVAANTFQPEDVEAMNAKLPDQVEGTAWVMRPELWEKVYNRRADGVMPGDSKGLFVFNFPRDLGAAGPTQFNGKKVVKSRQVSGTRGTGAQTYILTGYFPDWIIARLGVFEFMVDPYTQLAQYQTVIQAVQFIDAGPRHAASFVIADEVDIA